jgi:hypothetical protein
MATRTAAGRRSNGQFGSAVCGVPWVFFGVRYFKPYVSLAGGAHQLSESKQVEFRHSHSLKTSFACLAERQGNEVPSFGLVFVLIISVNSSVPTFCEGSYPFCNEEGTPRFSDPES